VLGTNSKSNHGRRCASLQDCCHRRRRHWPGRSSPKVFACSKPQDARYDIEFSWQHFDWICEIYLKADGLDQLRGFDAICLGAVGYPSVPDHISLWGLLIPIRRAFQQYVNLRPARLLRGIDSPVKNFPPGQIDLYVVRKQ
jgi:isocitrate/isopropylmalate dehydrogenase